MTYFFKPRQPCSCGSGNDADTLRAITAQAMLDHDFPKKFVPFDYEGHRFIGRMHNNACFVEISQ